MTIKRPSTKGLAAQIPDRGIIHSMAEYLFYEGKTRHASEFLEMIGLSVHILIDPKGDIFECRGVNQGAYHAKGNNVNTLGTEWLVKGEHDYESFLKAIKDPYLTDQQFSYGCEYIKDNWVKKCGVLWYERHSTIDPKRKHDPGDGFPFVEFLKNIGVVL